MGFYGNITNTNRTQFVFDKTYSNRAEMDAACSAEKGDGVYIGRYVLIDYDEGGTELVINPSETYSKNFEIDDLAYGYDSNGKHIGIGRGWDSTVWQKTYNDGVESYVSVAELNGVVPTLDLTVDAPSMNPVPPHFDAESTSMYYKLHIQPSWGFRIAEAKEGAPSDEYISTSERTWRPDEQKYKTEWINYAGNIHFNKAGFDSSTGYVTENDENRIYTTRGQSGRQYNDVHYYTNANGDTVKGYTTAKKDDIQELNIELPALGNAVATMWDIVYGKNSKGSRRNKEIGWNDSSGNRLINTAADGNGYTYDTEKVETLSGCINSVHDLMGMIIADDDTITADKALNNRIYYRDNKFYIKDLTYDYNEDDSTKPITLSSFTDDIYYQDSTHDLYRVSQENYNSSNYYYKIPADKVTAKEFCDEDWNDGYYYYRNESGDLVMDKADEPTEGRTYYTISRNQASTIKVYNRYDTGSDSNKTWCFLPGNYSDEVYNKIFPETETAGLFYYGSGSEPIKKYTQGNTKVNTDTRFVYIDGYTVEYKTEVGSNEPVAIYNTDSATHYEQFRMIEFEAGKFYSYDSENDKYILLQSLDDVSLDVGGYYYFKDGLSETFYEIKKPFYCAKRYYYIDGDDYKFGASAAMAVGKQYVEISDLESLHYAATFYEPNKYYYKDDEGVWHLDESESLTSDRTYYLDTFTKYVIEDTEGKLVKGMVWALPESVAVPSSVTLGVRTEKYEWKELKGFARTLNTIHGLIISINNLLKTGDTLTRDTSTVQGCINTLNDMISHFDALVPGLAVINQYGQISSGSLNDKIKSDSDVITQLSFDASTGAITSTRANIGELKLTGYALGTDSAVLGSTDTINGAFGKLQNQINNTLANAVQNTTKFSYNINEGVSQEKTIQEMFDYIATLEQRIAALETTD